MKKQRVQKVVALGVVLVASSLFAMNAYAQADNTQEKIRLMVSAVQARDSGDLAASKQSLEELLKIVPNDKAVQQLLMDVNNAIAAQDNAAPAAAPVAVDSDSAVASDEDSVAEEEAVAIAATPDDAVDAMLSKQRASLDLVYMMIEESYDLLDASKNVEAAQKLNDAEAKLAVYDSASPDILEAKDEITKARAALAAANAIAAKEAGNYADAKAYAADYQAKTDGSYSANRLVEQINQSAENPYENTLVSVSPDYVARQARIQELLKRGRIQYLYGDYEDARHTFREIESFDSDNMEAKAYQILISEKLMVVSRQTVENTRAQLLNDVNNAWQLPQVFQGGIGKGAGADVVSPVAAKLREIVIPEANFQDVPLSKVISTLSSLSVDYDKADGRGVNMVLFDNDGAKNITIVLRDSTLGQILDFTTKQVGFTYDIEDNVVVVRRGTGDSISTDTVDFPLTQATLIRMVGLSRSSGSDSNDPFSSGGSSGGEDQNEDKIKQFLIKAGVSFEAGASLAFDGTKLWVTNTRRNLDKVRNILMRYSEVKQVEIETKFMEVNQGNMKELGFNYSINRLDSEGNIQNVLFRTQNRTLASSRSDINAGSTPLTISEPRYGPGLTPGSTVVIGTTHKEYPQNVPALPATMNVGASALQAVDTVLGVWNGYDFNMSVTALQQDQGTDLLCAPKVTVLSGSTASITVSQEMRYPESWGDVQSNVGQGGGSNSGTGAAGVTITPGTPQDFIKYDVGVVMEVTPNVEDDGAINLALSPRITEFEGFMEYGGVAVALTSGTTVTVPSGFIQPVFTVREIRTSVTVFDGATVVMGGLTREEVRTNNDQMPILGDIPLLGRMFQSKGESRQKRNLLIFVTANRITPGGSVGREQFPAMRAGSVFQNPTVISPGGAVKRIKEVSDSTDE